MYINIHTCICVMCFQNASFNIPLPSNTLNSRLKSVAPTRMRSNAFIEKYLCLPSEELGYFAVTPSIRPRFSAKTILTSFTQSSWTTG